MTSLAPNSTLLRAAQQQISAKLAYARVSADLVIQETSDNLASMIQHRPNHSLVGEHLADSFYEFIGLEEVIEDQVQTKASAYKLERVNRSLPNGSLSYLDFTICPFDYAAPKDKTLLLIVENATDYGRLEQTIVQERNELRLAQRKLAKANTQLRRLDQLKSLFFSMAAHDLRSPLMVIRGLLRWCRQI